jgi:FtsZ-binding cell division protein ZapB
MRSLTPGGVALFLVLLAASGIGYAVVRQSETLLPLYVASSTAMAATGVAVVLVLLALVLAQMYGRLEARAEAAVAMQASFLQRQIDMLHEENKRQAAEILEARTAHNACQQQVADIASALAKGRIA